MDGLHSMKKGPQELYHLIFWLTPCPCPNFSGNDPQAGNRIIIVFEWCISKAAKSHRTKSNFYVYFVGSTLVLVLNSLSKC